MRTVPSLAVATTFLLLSLAVPPAAAEATFDETTVLEDPQDISSGAMDIRAVHVVERYLFDFDKAEPISGGDAVFVRFDLENAGDLPTGIPVRYHVFFDAGGQARDYWAEATESCSPIAGCSIAVTSNVQAAYNEARGMTLVIPYETAGFSKGDAFEGIWAATAAGTADNPVWQDVAPKENTGPEVQEPAAPSSSGNYTLAGPYPYVTLQAKEPLTKLSVHGNTVVYRFDLVPAAGISGEIVKIFATPAEGWQVETNRGDRVSEISNFGASSAELAVTVSSPLAPAPGETATTTLELVSSSGAHGNVTLVTEVTGPKIDSNAFNFTMLSEASFDKGDNATLSFRVVDALGSAPAGAKVSFDLLRDGAVVDTVEAESDGNGTFTGHYAFPSEGEWTIDVYIVSMEPSPHAEFVVSVGSGGVLGVPGPGPLALLVALLGILVVVRRRR
jgi:hypothetical protein